MTASLLRRSLTVAIVPLALLGVGCSGEADDDPSAGSGGSGGGSAVDPKCDASFMPTVPSALLDDLEDGNSQVANVLGRNGSWWLSTDGTDGTVTPGEDAAPPPERILGKRCDSEQAIRVTGQGFTSWGAVLTVGMAYSSQADPVDLSGFSGLMFWARVGELNTSAIRVQFQDSNTAVEGGVCNPQSGTPDECYNGHGIALVPISTEWRLYKLPFADMTQRDGWGYQAEALDTTAIYNIEWNLDPNSVFDLWVDDVWFY